MNSKEINAKEFNVDWDWLSRIWEIDDDDVRRVAIARYVIFLTFVKARREDIADVSELRIEKEWEKEIVEMQIDAKFDNWDDLENAKEIYFLFSFLLIKMSSKNVETSLEISSLSESHSEVIARS